MAPTDFARPLSTGGFKHGSCGNVTNTGDDQLICRLVSLQVQDITSNVTLPVTTITIVRPPVILVHGLWGSFHDWDNFNPLVKSPSALDSRFSIDRFDYSYKVGATISNPSPAYQTVANATASSLGFQYNAPALYMEIVKWISSFKLGRNSPTNIAVAAVQADIVAHSMGGDITRTMALSPTFLNDPNQPTFGKGIVHKLITIDTPHLGSPLAHLLLLATNACTRGKLAGSSFYSFTSVTLQAGNNSTCGTTTSPVANSTCGGVGDIDPASISLAAINSAPQPQPYYFPTALIAGIYTNFASLNCGGLCSANMLRSSQKYGCPNDPLAQSLTQTGWPANFAPDTQNDAIVPLGSQLDMSPNPSPNAGIQRTGFVHSTGTENLSFTRPSMLDPDVVGSQTSVPQTVINLLNTPVTNQTVFSPVNP